MKYMHEIVSLLWKHCLNLRENEKSLKFSISLPKIVTSITNPVNSKSMTCLMCLLITCYDTQWFAQRRIAWQSPLGRSLSKVQTGPTPLNASHPWSSPILSITACSITILDENYCRINGKCRGLKYTLSILLVRFFMGYFSDHSKPCMMLDDH